MVGLMIFSLIDYLENYSSTRSSGFSQNQAPADLDYSSVEVIYDIVRDNYYEPLNPDDLLTGLKRGLVEAVGDPHTVYFDKESAEKYLEELDQSELEGIGALVDLKDGFVVIVSTFKNSPAAEAGLKSKDLIIEVDGQSIRGLTAEEAVSLIKGPAGTSVELKVRRDDQEDFIVKVVPAKNFFSW